MESIFNVKEQFKFGNWEAEQCTLYVLLHFFLHKKIQDMYLFHLNKMIIKEKTDFYEH